MGLCRLFLYGIFLSNTFPHTACHFPSYLLWRFALGGLGRKAFWQGAWGDTLCGKSVPWPPAATQPACCWTKSHIGFTECFTVHRYALIFAFSFIAKLPMGGVTAFLYFFNAIPAGVFKSPTRVSQLTGASPFCYIFSFVPCICSPWDGSNILLLIYIDTIDCLFRCPPFSCWAFLVQTWGGKGCRGLIPDSFFYIIRVESKCAWAGDVCLGAGDACLGMGVLAPAWHMWHACLRILLLVCLLLPCVETFFKYWSIYVNHLFRLSSTMLCSFIFSITACLLASPFFQLSFTQKINIPFSYPLSSVHGLMK